ncbi:MAG TPA: hypothetical protein VHX63_04865 [Acidobacteriaceae bacterium]|jgi:hypothetical protein|nr:hypothetical protein [Acidobacteriaceae bacterium]
MRKHGKSLFEAAQRMAFLGLACLLAVVVAHPAFAQHYTGTDNGITSHLTFEGGGGFVPAAGGTAANVNSGWGIMLGGGYMLNHKVGMMLEYNFDHNNIPNSILSEVDEPGGYYHFWTLTANPIYNYWTGNKLGGYITGGGGFSRKVVSFTQPILVQYCYIYGCYEGYENSVVYHFSSNQPVVDLGTGITFRLSPYNRMKFFADARFVKMYTTASQIPGHNAQIIPVTFGVRW